MTESIKDKIRAQRAAAKLKRQQAISNIRARTGIAGLGLDGILDITLQDIESKGLLPTIQSKTKVIRARARQKVGMKTDLVSRAKDVVSGKSTRILPRSKSVAEPGEAEQAAPAQVPAEVVMPSAALCGEMDLARSMNPFAAGSWQKTSIKRRTA